MDRFYYDLLNIGKKKMDDKDYFEILNRVILEETAFMKKDNPSLDFVCKIISTKINCRLKELNFDTKIINTKELYDMFEHQFVISSYIDLNDEVNYILIDPTYSQFINKNEYNFKTLTSADFLGKTKEGKIMLDSLLCLGFYKIDDNDLKRYIASIMYEDDINKIDITINDLILERRR